MYTSESWYIKEWIIGNPGDRTSNVPASSNAYITFFWKWALSLLNSQAIIPGLCIAKMHTAVQESRVSMNKKTVKYISIMSNCSSPKVKEEDQSVDYASTYVGKKYPSP
jgi:hypothetical protein